MTKKMTKRAMFEQMLTHLTDPAEIAFVEHELELLDKRTNSGRPAKKTATQVANEGIKSTMLDAMEVDARYTIDEIKGMVDELAAASNQKVSALLTQLINSGDVVKTYDKRKAYFAKA